MPPPIVLRDYQQELVDLALAEIATHRRVCLYAPTGGGKTEMGLALVRHFLEAGQRPMWIANRIDLIEQTSKRFAKSGLDHGIVQGYHARTSYRKQVQICSIHTLTRRRKLPETDVIFVDEAHGAVAPTYRKFLDAQDVPVIGLTATPFSKGLGEVFQSLVHTPAATIAELTQTGWLVPARYFAPDRPDLKGIKIVAGDYHETQLADRLNTTALVGNIVAEWRKRADGLKTVIFATNIAHSKHIVETFKADGVAAEHLDAYTEPGERAAIIERLRRGDTRVVSNVSVLAEGFDCPDMECMILARPTRSIIRYLQMVGRVLRPAPGKQAALVLDHSSTVERLGFADDERPLELDDGKRKEVEPPAKLPHICPKCKAVSAKKAVPCPVCGFVPEVKAPEIVEHEQGELRELVRMTSEQKGHLYGELKRIAIERRRSDGWIAHTFRKITGVWPNHFKHVPAAEYASQWTINKVRQFDIAYAKSQERRAA
jgi:DNA or RNA helicases of superfamily II